MGKLTLNFIGGKQATQYCFLMSAFIRNLVDHSVIMFISDITVSDDNSSIQSSPWQREHTWKQSSPRRNLAKEMTFFFWRRKHFRISFARSTKRCRRPHSVQDDAVPVLTGSERTSELNASCNNSEKKKHKVRTPLLSIAQMLVEKAATAAAATTTMPSRADAVVSPRKRFLREMERTPFNADGSQKRSRNKTAVVQKIDSPVSFVVSLYS